MNNAPRNPRILTAVLALSLFATAPLTAQNNATPDVLLQRAMQTEKVDGDLSAAIDLYKTVANARGASRSVTASALLHLGQAYEKLGSAEARKAYERIAREFADQKEVAADAGRRLAALSGAQGSNAHGPRPVSSPGNEPDVAISFDGRWMVTTIWNNPDRGDNHLVVQDIATGETKRLLTGSCGKQKPCTFSGSVIPSPDGREVAYSWYDDAEIEGRAQLRVISTETGAAPRVLIRNPEFGIWPSAFSPDGKAILVTMGDPPRDRGLRLGWASIADGSLRVIKSLESRLLHDNQISLSPDGQYVAYAARTTNPKNGTPSATDPMDAHIYILASDGSGEVALVKTAGLNKSPVWTPDGSHLVFTSNLSGKTDLWAVAVRDGKAAGSPTLLKRDIGAIEPIGMTKAGAYYYRDRQRRSRVEQVFVAELTPGGGSRILESFVGLSPSWSPDGKSIAFKRHRLQTEAYWYYTVVRSVETGQESAVSRDVFRGDPPRWLREGRSVLTLEGTASQSDGGDQWWNLVDLHQNSSKRLLPAGPRHHFIHLSPDDRTFYCAARDPNDKSGRFNQIVAVDLATGQERQVFRLPGTPESLPYGAGIGLTLSPDGRTLAIAALNPQTSETRLARVDVDGSNYRELYGPYQVRRRTTFDRLKWTKDGRSIVFAMSARDKGWQIMRIGSEGGTPEFTGLMVADLGTFDISPDGTRIAYFTAAGGVDSDQALFAIDNLPALLKGAQ
jgi:Tol biopolymer transport system component